MTKLSFLYVCMVNTIYLLSFVETPRKFIIAELRSVSIYICIVIWYVLYIYNVIWYVLIAIVFVKFEEKSSKYKCDKNCRSKSHFFTVGSLLKIC